MKSGVCCVVVHVYQDRLLLSSYSFSRAVSKPVRRSHSKCYAYAHRPTTLERNASTDIYAKDTIETNTQDLPTSQEVEKEEVRDGGEEECSKMEDTEVIYASTSTPINPMLAGAGKKSSGLVESDRELDTELYEHMLAIGESPHYKNLPHKLSHIPEIYENCPHTPYMLWKLSSHSIDAMAICMGRNLKKCTDTLCITTYSYNTSYC